MYIVVWWDCLIFVFLCWDSLNMIFILQIIGFHYFYDCRILDCACALYHMLSIHHMIVTYTDSIAWLLWMLFQSTWACKYLNACELIPSSHFLSLLGLIWWSSFARSVFPHAFWPMAQRSTLLGLRELCRKQKLLHVVTEQTFSISRLRLWHGRRLNITLSNHWD